MITQAIRNLRPTASFAIEGETYEDLRWSDVNVDPPPSKEEVELEVLRLQTEYNSKQYQRQRAPEYPDVRDQLDMIWHGMDTGAFPKLDSFYDAIKAIKDKYPKGN